MMGRDLRKRRRKKKRRQKQKPRLNLQQKLQPRQRKKNAKLRLKKMAPTLMMMDQWSNYPVTVWMHRKATNHNRFTSRTLPCQRTGDERSENCGAGY
jgi:hypothetical protein